MTAALCRFHAAPNSIVGFLSSQCNIARGEIAQHVQKILLAVGLGRMTNKAAAGVRARCRECASQGQERAAGAGAAQQQRSDRETSLTGDGSGRERE
ncbi:hypothetical protein chiPu_0010470 [Chiloscyllium punctatum]|uniref:Uncharacterized protein n=1 Tax=Chiloscyllium punctatum TaxID=137246 RepID=A0A401SNP5_CHIPU|nr:hypothetical protein [Chiloscyllium punctatum]